MSQRSSERGVDRTNHWSGYAHSVHLSKVLHLGRRSNHHTRELRREDVNPRDQRHWHYRFCKRIEGRAYGTSNSATSTSHSFKKMETKNIIFGLPKFNGEKGQVCEACQLGKQHQLPFPNERNQSRKKLDLIHLSVWGPT